MKLTAKIFIEGKIEVLTGLTIGGSSTALDIGGIDNPVIKKANGEPYIPGSSLKGKIRCLLERESGRFHCEVREKYKDLNGKEKVYIKTFNEIDKCLNYKPKHENSKLEFSSSNCDCGECKICKIFGTGGISNSIQGPTRVYFRDAYLDDDIANKMKNKEGNFSDLEMDYTESKTENIIDRLTSTASHPRPIERVPAGAKFNYKIVYNIFEYEDIKNLDVLLKGMRHLEDDYLGGSGSRGYGKIKFDGLKMEIKTTSDYETDNKRQIIFKIFNLHKSFTEIEKEIKNKVGVKNENG